MEKRMSLHPACTQPKKQKGLCKFTGIINLNSRIMFKNLLMAIGVMLIAVAAKSEDGIKTESKVQKVVVFLNSAQVTRTATVNVTGGTSTITFTNLSPGIDVQSIQVHANGEFTILAVKYELNFLNLQVKQKSVEDLQAQQKLIQDKIAIQNSLLAVDEQEEAMLLKNQVISGANTNLEILKLQQALDFQTARLTEIKKKQQSVNAQIAVLNTELQKYNMQIAEINKGRSTTTGNILVTVSSKIALQSEFTLSYVVNNASWFPTYDIRAKNVNSPISIAYKANVSQQSGEDWKNIKLTLSTGNPTISGSKPEITPYFLNFGMYNAGPTGSITKVIGRLTDRSGSALPGAAIKIKGTSIGTVADAAGNYTIQIPPGNQTLVFTYIGYETAERAANTSVINVALTEQAHELNEVVVTGYGTQLWGKVAGMAVTTARLNGKDYEDKTMPVAMQQIENQTNIEFNIDNPYSIPSDGKQYLVEINQIDLPATYQYEVVPKLSTDVFLTAQLTDWSKYNFLSGEANLFFEGTFIGKSLIDTRAVTDTLNLSLGVDKNIAVTRTSQKDLTEKQSFGSNKKETRNWLIDVKNRKNQPINLLVEDQIPVSQNSAIEVETQDISGGTPDKESGKIAWNLKLNPADEKKIQLKYQVRYPKNQSVIVQ